MVSSRSFQNARSQKVRRKRKGPIILSTVEMKIAVPRAFAALVSDLASLNGITPEEQLIECTLMDLELNVSENRQLATKYGLGEPQETPEYQPQLRALARLEGR